MADKSSSKLRLLDIAMPGVLAAATLVLGLLIEDLGLGFDWRTVALVAAVAILGATIGCWFMWVLIRYYSAHNILQVQQAVISLATAESITNEYLAEYERSCRCKEIWVVTPDLVYDREGAMFRDIVFKNVRERDVRYTYVVPDSERLLPVIKRYLRGYTEEEKADRIRFLRLSLEAWQALPYVDGDFVVYNPAMEPGIPTDCFYELPVAGRGRWVRVDEKIAEDWIGRVQKVLPQIVEADNDTRSEA